MGLKYIASGKTYDLSGPQYTDIKGGTKRLNYIASGKTYQLGLATDKTCSQYSPLVMRINGANHYIGRSTSGTLSSSRSRSTSNTYTTETTVAETLYGTWNVYGTDYSTWFNSSRTTYSESGAGQVYTVVGTARFTSTTTYLWAYEDGIKKSVLRSEIYIPVGSYDTWRGHSIQSSTSSSSISSSYSCSTSSHNFV